MREENVVSVTGSAQELLRFEGGRWRGVIRSKMERETGEKGVKMARHDSVVGLRDEAEDSVRLSRETERQDRGMQKSREKHKRKGTDAADGWASSPCCPAPPAPRWLRLLLWRGRG